MRSPAARRKSTLAPRTPSTSPPRRQSTRTLRATSISSPTAARASLPQLFAALSTREKARRAAKSPRMRAALNRLRAELATLDADIALVRVIAADGGESDVLTPHDCNVPAAATCTDDCGRTKACAICESQDEGSRS